ncbi:MAG: HD domain-containing protein [Actinomycetota bacterium]|nr:HD domain-containing protein [Actinomycetota bacterium]
MEEIEAIVARAGTHPVWGYKHCLRVHALAEAIAASERLSYDEEILRAAALLHDIGLYKAYAFREAPDHARRSATVAERILKDGDFPPQATRAVVEAIIQHPPGVPGGGSTEAALLKDAVALDYLGAIGLSRMLAMVGLEDDVPDIPAALWQAENLRQKIPDLLIFDASRLLARERILEMDDFIKQVRNATANLKLL